MLNVSNTILFLRLSSPLRTDKVNVPLEIFLFEISHLKLSEDPFLSELSVLCPPGSNDAEELL